MQGLIDDFVSYKRHNKGRSRRLEQMYRLALRRLCEFFGDRDPLQATHEELVAFTGKWLFDRGLKDPLSRRTHVSAVREFFKWAHQSNHVARDPAAGVPQPASGLRLPRVMTLEHAEKLMWAPDYATFEGLRDAAMIALLIGCGFRVGGLVALNESNLTSESINGRQRLVIKVREKGNKDRKVPVPEQADLVLRLYLEHPDLAAIDRLLEDGDKVLFVSTKRRDIGLHDYRGEARRMRAKGVLRAIKKHGQDAGIPEAMLHPHAMRHLFGTELAEDDVPTITAQKLMGHADPKNTELYQHLAMRKLTRVVDKANPLSKMRTPASDIIARLKG